MGDRRSRDKQGDHDTVTLVPQDRRDSHAQDCRAITEESSQYPAVDQPEPEPQLAIDHKGEHDRGDELHERHYERHQGQAENPMPGLHDGEGTNDPSDRSAHLDRLVGPISLQPLQHGLKGSGRKVEHHLRARQCENPDTHLSEVRPDPEEIDKGAGQQDKESAENEAQGNVKHEQR